MFSRFKEKSSKLLLQDPQEGDTQVRKIFLFFPKTLKTSSGILITKWMSYESIVYEYKTIKDWYYPDFGFDDCTRWWEKNWAEDTNQKALFQFQPVSQIGETQIRKVFCFSQRP